MTDHLKILPSDTVEFYSSGHTVEVPLGDFASKLFSSSGEDLIPINLRWADFWNDIYVLEFPPRYQRIGTTKILGYTGRSKKEEGVYEVPLPWQVVIFDQSHFPFRIFFRTEQLRSLDDTLYHSYLSNVYRDGMPCTGWRYPTADKTLAPLDRCRKQLNDFWMSGFNGAFYTSSPGASMGGGQHQEPVKLDTKILLPAQMEDLYGRSAWAETNPYKWLAQFSLPEILEWDLKPAGSLRELLPPPEKSRFKTLRSKFLQVRKTE